MANDKIVTINYQSADEAAAMAAKINASDQDGEVRVVNHGNSLVIAPANPMVADLLAFFSWAGRNIAELFRKSEVTSSKGAVNA
ncbi:MAG: hypothetical protein WD623_07695 [Marinobacter sp.]|uniref:hypothetical protein n=1 Tax=Marinobacter sp. TaxID=50741 RepID=UPI0034A0614C